MPECKHPKQIKSACIMTKTYLNKLILFVITLSSMEWNSGNICLIACYSASTERMSVLKGNV